MLDRVPLKPNRYAVYDDAHNFLRYEYHERADEPTQAGDALNKNNLLPDSAATALGLTGNPQVADALAKLAVGAGKYGYYLTVKYADGSPVIGISITGLVKIDGSECITDSNGNMFGVSTSSSPTISITGYLDIQSYTTNVTSTGIITQVPITLTNAANIGTISTSQTLKSSRSAVVDIHLIGAGESGYYGDTSAGDQTNRGGASGKAYYVAGKTMAKNKSYPAVVSASYGGATTWFGMSSDSGSDSAGGTLNHLDGSGGGISPIANNLIFGGSGGCGSFYGGAPGYGSNGGGNGGANAADGYPGTKPGAGGGGAGGSGTSGGKGGAGAIYYKWRYA